MLLQFSDSEPKIKSAVNAGIYHESVLDYFEYKLHFTACYDLI